MRASSSPTRSAPTAAGCGTCKLDEKLDKDRFRQDLGGVAEAYQEVARRLGLLPEGEEANAVLDLDEHRKKRGK